MAAAESWLRNDGGRLCSVLLEAPGTQSTFTNFNGNHRKLMVFRAYRHYDLSNQVAVVCCLSVNEQNEYHIQVAHSLGFPMSPNTTMFDED